MVNTWQLLRDVTGSGCISDGDLIYQAYRKYLFIIQKVLKWFPY
jgi:hypothetical protein